MIRSFQWFPKRKGLVNGITVGGYGLGALIFTYVQTSYLNPQNLSPNADGYFSSESILSRVPLLFVLLSGIYLTIQLIGCCLIFTPPRQPNEIIFDEGRFLLIRSPGDDVSTLTFESPIGNNETAGTGDYSSCDDQELLPRQMPQTDLTYQQAVWTKEFVLVTELINLTEYKYLTLDSFRCGLCLL